MGCPACHQYAIPPRTTARGVILSWPEHYTSTRRGCTDPVAGVGWSTEESGEVPAVGYAEAQRERESVCAVGGEVR